MAAKTKKKKGPKQAVPVKTFTPDQFTVGEWVDLFYNTDLTVEPTRRATGLVVETGSMYLKLKSPAMHSLITILYPQIVNAKPVPVVKSVSETGDPLVQELFSLMGFANSAVVDGWQAHWMNEASSLLIWRRRKIIEDGTQIFYHIEAPKTVCRPAARYCEEDGVLEIMPNLVNEEWYKHWLQEQDKPPIVPRAFGYEQEGQPLERVFVFEETGMEENGRKRIALFVLENMILTFSSGLRERDIDRLIPLLDAQ